jgi:hypothetical protein
MTRDTTDALLFDLGNVFFDLDFNLAVARWAAHAACDEALIRERFRMHCWRTHISPGHADGAGRGPSKPCHVARRFVTSVTTSRRGSLQRMHALRSVVIGGEIRQQAQPAAAPTSKRASGCGSREEEATACVAE